MPRVIWNNPGEISRLRGKGCSTLSGGFIPTEWQVGFADLALSNYRTITQKYQNKTAMQSTAVFTVHTGKYFVITQARFPRLRGKGCSTLSGGFIPAEWQVGFADLALSNHRTITQKYQNKTAMQSTAVFTVHTGKYFVITRARFPRLRGKGFSTLSGGFIPAEWQVGFADLAVLNDGQASYCFKALLSTSKCKP